MAASNTEISNLALSHIGIGKEIANLEAEKTQEAAACRRFYATALDVTLRKFAWPFASKIAALGLIETLTDTNTDAEHTYSYRYPSDCVKARRILSGIRNDTRQSRVHYKILSDTAGRIIHTDQINAELEYTFRADDPSLYPNDFAMALSYRLAGYISARLTKGDPFKIRAEVLQLFEFEVTQARSTAGNEEQPEELPDSEFVRTRE